MHECLLLLLCKLLSCEQLFRVNAEAFCLFCPKVCVRDRPRLLVALLLLPLQRKGLNIPKNSRLGFHPLAYSSDAIPFGR